MSCSAEVELHFSAISLLIRSVTAGPSLAKPRVLRPRSIQCRISNVFVNYHSVKGIRLSLFNGASTKILAAHIYSSALPPITLLPVQPTLIGKRKKAAPAFS